MPLPNLNTLPATQLSVRLTGGPVPHPASGYRLWRGQFDSTEPIVALVLAITGNQVRWTRTSHRGLASLPTSILFSPNDEEGRNVQSSLTILDAAAIGHSCLNSPQAQPTPLLQTVPAGQLASIATIGAEPPCELKALFLARRDVASVRNGVWHARGEWMTDVTEPWRTILTYGRTGEFELS